MQLIKMKIKRENFPGRTHYEYPSCFDAKKVKFGPVYERGFKNPERRGHQYILIGVPDKDAPRFLNADGLREKGFTFEASLVSREEALALGSLWGADSRTEKITDDQTVLRIVAKVARGEPLSKEDEEALDPDHPAPGIRRSPSFQERLDEALEKW